MTSSNWSHLSEQLVSALGLDAPPIAITFSQRPIDGVPAYDAPMPEATTDGRTGRVPAGCVFWMKATDRTFTTVPDDHRNCSVGSLTHGMVTLSEAAGNADVAALLESGWVTMDMVPTIPVVADRPGAVTYGPLADTPVDPDVVLLRVIGRQLMVLSDAVPDMKISGKPQCHIVAMAKEGGDVAASVGCALSRVRTQMPADEMTCAIPGSRLADVVDRVHRALKIQSTVQNYAVLDAKRFGS